MAVWLAAATLVVAEAAAKPDAKAEADAEAKPKAKPDANGVYPAPCYPETIYHTQYIPKVHQVRVHTAKHVKVTPKQVTVKVVISDQDWSDGVE